VEKSYRKKDRQICKIPSVEIPAGYLQRKNQQQSGAENDIPETIGDFRAMRLL